MTQTEIWRMRRLTAYEHPQLWHRQKGQENGKYITVCGRRFGIAGSREIRAVPAGACARCLKGTR